MQTTLKRAFPTSSQITMYIAGHSVNGPDKIQSRLDMTSAGWSLKAVLPAVVFEWKQTKGWWQHNGPETWPGQWECASASASGQTVRAGS